MKQLTACLLMVTLGLWSASQGGKNKTKVMIRKGNDVVLVYTGGVTSGVNIGMRVQIEIDSLIGVRYEVVYQSGDRVMAHTAIFYKFSTPLQSVLYNFLTHDSTVNYATSAVSKNPQLTVVGQEVVDSFTCTHLRHASQGIEDYWVSTQVPGYTKLVNALASISSNMPEIAIDGTIFRWGGLVRMIASYTDRKGRTVSANLGLVQADPNVSVPASDFDVPTN